MRFEHSGRGQEPSRGHKFSILENFLSIRDFASQTLASFLSDLVGACLPQPLLRSNMGDKKMYIDNGIRGLAETKGCRIEAISDYLITEPYGVTDQDEFLNGVLKMRTLLTPEELLVRLHQLEQAANRERIIHWGPRTLDLDILFYDQEIIDMPDLHIPHIDLHNRDFVLVPMNQIAPYLRHPVLNQTISQLLDSLLNKSENTAK